MTLLSPFLTTPVDFIATQIRTRREAAVLVSIGGEASRVDTLLEAATMGDRATRIAEDPSVAYQNMAPLCAQVGSVSPSLWTDLESCRDRMISLGSELKSFLEMNEASAVEFEEAGCLERAAAKNKVALVERTLVARLQAITGTFPNDEAGGRKRGCETRGSDNIWMMAISQLCDGRSQSDNHAG